MQKEDKDLLKINEESESEGEGEGNDEAEGKEGEKGETKPETKSQKHRTLKQKERIVYAPFSNLGFLNYEKTGGYINIPDKYVFYTRKDKIDKFDEEKPENEENVITTIYHYIIYKT